MRICVEIIQRLTEIPGVTGVRVLAFGCEQGIPEILERRGLSPPGEVGPGSPASRAENSR